MNVYIISWLGGAIREKRKELHTKQIAHLKATMPDAKITVVAQGYTEEDKHDGVDYIISEKCSPAVARNQLLKRFYASDEELGLFCDDDCIIDERFFGGTRLLDDLDNDDHKFFDLLEPVYGRMQPTHAIFASDTKYQEFNCFEAKKTIKTSMFVMRNLRLKYGKEVYFDETLNEQEDMEFSLRLRSLDMRVYKFANLVADDMGSSYSALMMDLHGDVNAHDDRKNDVFDAINEKYADKHLWKGPKQTVKRSYIWKMEWDKTSTGKRTKYTIITNEESKDESPFGNLFG